MSDTKLAATAASSAFAQLKLQPALLKISPRWVTAK